MEGVNRAIDIAIKWCADLASIILVTMTGLITLEVIMRFFGFSMLFTEEYSGYMVLTLMLLGVAYSREKNALLTVDFFFERLPPRTQRVLATIYGLASLCFCLLLTYYLTKFFLGTYARKAFAATTTQTPLWIPQIFFPIGMFLLSIVVFRKLFRPDAKVDKTDALNASQE